MLLPLPTYKTIDDNPKMGLNNKLCEKPYAFCEIKRVWLSEEDVEVKKCFHRPTIDFIAEEKCRRLKLLHN